MGAHVRRFVATMDSPTHVALIMDGNRRWARRRRCSYEAGYRAGMQITRRLVDHAIERKVRVLSFFTFSNENRHRPAHQVSLLLGLFAEALSEHAENFLAHGVRLRVIGDLQCFKPKLRQQIERLHKRELSDPCLTVCVAMHYGGRQDLLRAAVQCQEEGVSITEEAVSARLGTGGLADPDLLIRTGGEFRLSNFMLWQMAYTEFYFTDTLWPDFDEGQFDAALGWFASRDRRFGVSSA